MSLRKEIVSLLDEMADLMEFSGQNRFKVNAFRNGSNTIRRLEGDLEDKINDKSINEIKGIGKGLQQVIYEFYETGSAKEYEELLENVPDGIHDILKIRGLGAKKVRLLYDELKIDSIEGLERICNDGSIAQLKGFGEKSAAKIIEEITRIKKSRGFMLLSLAYERSKKIKNIISTLDPKIKLEVTGEIRLVREVISKIELICCTNKENQLLENLDKIFNCNILESASLFNIYSLTNEDTGEFTLYVTSKENFEKVLLQTTGSSEFLQKMHDPTKSKFPNEYEYFKLTATPYVIPEMRELEYFSLDEKLREQSILSLEHFSGFFHFHTTSSDGTNTLPEMIDAVACSGFKYAVVCDHSKAAFYANGLTEQRVLKQREEIEEFNKTSKIKVYHGIECDILRDGALDYPDNFLSNFQFIVASIHSIFNLSEEEMTNRIIKAVENPFTDVIAHPTGRLLLSRDGYKVNIRKVIDACVSNDVAIEINANPHRLDLDWRNLFYARNQGCKITINPDAHSTDGVLDIEYGIMIARKSGVQPSEVINCLGEKDFIKFINRKVKRQT